MFQGFVVQEGSLVVTVLASNSSKTPVNLDALPTYRIYGPGGLMPSGTGTLSFKDSGTVTSCTNASPIVVGSVGHGLSTGTTVTITGVGGNTNANGTFTVTVVNADHFSLNGTTGNSAYTTGGTWNTTGLYTLTVSALGANGFAAGSTYSILVSGALSSTAWADLHTFCVG